MPDVGYPMARSVMRGAGVGLAAGLFSGAVQDRKPEETALSHYARHALDGTMIGAGAGLGGAIIARRFGRGAAVPAVQAVEHAVTEAGAPIRAAARVTDAAPAQAAARAAPARRAVLQRTNPVPAQTLQLPATTGHDIAAPGVLPRPPSGGGPSVLGSTSQLRLPPNQRARATGYSMGPAVVDPRLRVDDRFTMGGANGVPRVDEPYKLGALRARSVFGG